MIEPVMRSIAAIPLLLSLALPATASAECVSVLPTENDRRFDLAARVFLGEVDDTEWIIDPTGTKPLRIRVTFRVLERFKGDEGKHVTFSHSAESFDFKQGQRLLVFAAAAGEDTSTTCAQPRVIISDDDAELRRLRRAARG